jgi:hypothetical protein
MKPEDFYRQAKVKMRLIAAREMRQYRAGQLDYLPGNLAMRTTLDAIKQAYAAGLRDGRGEPA